MRLPAGTAQYRNNEKEKQSEKESFSYHFSILYHRLCDFFYIDIGVIKGTGAADWIGQAHVLEHRVNQHDRVRADAGCTAAVAFDEAAVDMDIIGSIGPVAKTPGGADGAGTNSLDHFYLTDYILDPSIGEPGLSFGVGRSDQPNNIS